MKTYTQFLAEQQYHDVVKDFTDYCKEFLELPKKPDINVSFDPEAAKDHKTFGYYNQDGKITVHGHGRHIVDTLRTIAHEMTHFAQHQTTDQLDGSTGSVHENEANAKAGVILRNYGRANPHLFVDQPEVSGDVRITESKKINNK